MVSDVEKELLTKKEIQELMLIHGEDDELGEADVSGGTFEYGGAGQE